MITMDMGGTSLDVCVIRGGQAELADTLYVEWGIPIKTPALDVKTIGAGGGSIVWIDDGGAIRVGPQSAGAVPGPACYGQGGTECTVTDANMILGILDPDHFASGRLALDRRVARSRPSSRSPTTSGLPRRPPPRASTGSSTPTSRPRSGR